MEKVRYKYIDLIKLIAIMCVIVLHSINLKINFIDNNNVKQYIQFLVRILIEGVPIFVCINGFLIINKKFDLKKHLSKTLKIFIILLIWCIIDIITIKLLRNENINIKNIIENVMLTDISNTYTGTLWFLQNLIMLYLVFPVLKVLHDENKKIYNYLFIIVGIFTVGLKFVNSILIIVQDMSNIKIAIYFSTFFSKYNPIQNGSFLFFFMLGGYIFEKKEILEIKKNRIYCVLIGIISIGLAFLLGVITSKVSKHMVSDSFNYCTIFTGPIIILMFTIFYKWNEKDKIYNKLIMDIGKNSLGIYLVHKIVIVFFPICILITSYLIIKIIRKIPIIKKTVEL